MSRTACRAPKRALQYPVVHFFSSGTPKTRKGVRCLCHLRSRCECLVRIKNKYLAFLILLVLICLMARKSRIPEFHPELAFVVPGETVAVQGRCSAFGSTAKVLSVYFPKTQRGTTREQAAAVLLESGLETCVWLSELISSPAPLNISALSQ